MILSIPVLRKFLFGFYVFFFFWTLQIPNFRLHKTGNSFLAKSIEIYNKIPQNLTELPFHKLKRNIKCTLIKKGYYKVQDYLDDKHIWK
jgi:hypothetical protein